MTRSITAMGTAALCAIALASIHVGLSAQTKTPAKAPAKTTAAKAAPAKAAPAKTAAAKVAEPVDPNSITLTGCLEAEGRTFMLTDLEGAQAPKGRSWKTGFVTKKTKNVTVTSSSSSVHLGDHLGHKVSVVGVSNGDDTLQARSIKQIATSCS